MRTIVIVTTLTLAACVVETLPEDDGGSGSVYTNPCADWCEKAGTCSYAGACDPLEREDPFCHDGRGFCFSDGACCKAVSQTDCENSEWCQLLDPNPYKIGCVLQANEVCQ
jgi:hypothetical protein